MYTAFWWGNLSEKDHLDDLGIEGRIILGWIFLKQTGSSWLSIGTDGGYL